MRTYSTCEDCGLLLDTAGRTQQTHLNCAPHQDPVRELAELYVQAINDGRDEDARQLEAALDRPPREFDMLAAALTYAGWGWKVFPCHPGGKTPMSRHGVKDATTDEAKIRAWWRSAPAANIGVACGGTFDVIDIDTPKAGAEPSATATPEEAWAIRHGGWRSLWAMQDADAMPPAHGIVGTPSGGVHYYIAQPIHNKNDAGILPGVDYRTQGGYAIAPPSIGDNGVRYSWRSKPSPAIKSAA